MILRLILLICFALPLGVSANDKRLAQADFPERLAIKGQELVLRNASVLRYLFIDVYSAALLTLPDQPLANPIRLGEPLHLELYYYRDIDREDVIKAAWVALERQYDQETLTQLRPGIEALHDTFTDINAGDRYALTLDHKHALTLKYNGEVAFSSDDSALARAYVGIWLRENGLSDDLRAKLTAGR